MIRQSDSIAKLAAALVKAQAEVENATRNAMNPHLGAKYANLEEVLRVVKPPFAAHGLAVIQAPGMDGNNATVETTLLHESGEWLTVGIAAAPLPVGKTNRKGEPIPVDAQDVGSAITYLRRYSMAALASITQEDDDGQGVKGVSGKEGAISDEQAGELKTLMKDVDADPAKFLAYMKVATVEQIPRSKFDAAKQALGRKREENGQKKAVAK